MFSVFESKIIILDHFKSYLDSTHLLIELLLKYFKTVF